MAELVEDPLSLLATQARQGDVFVRQIDESGRLTHTLTWIELFDRCTRGAASLAREFQPGTPVCVWVRQDVESIVTVLSCVIAGLRVVFLHPGATEVEARSCELQAGAQGYVECLGNAGGAVARQPGGIILSSSGTTAGPRMAVRDWQSLIANGRAAAGGLGLRCDDQVLVSVPICHSYGVDIVCASLISGATMILLQRATPLSLAEGLASRAAVWPTVPFQLEQAVRLDCVSHVPRTVVTAGSWLPEGLWRLARERWGVNVGQLYGATEVGTVSVRLGRSDDGANAISVIGTGVGDASLVVVDRNDPTRICMVDEEGELLVRASSMASGYIDGPLRLSDGYWHSGDVARRRSDGEIEITGRWRLLIDVGGFKVNPIEVERVIASHPGVAACLVVGVRASETVERLRALYVQSDAAPPVAEPALRAFVRERLSAAKVPRSFERVDALPRSATGKIMRAHVP